MLAGAIWIRMTTHPHPFQSHEHSTHPPTASTGVNRPVHRAQSTMTMTVIYQAHSSRTSNIFTPCQATVRPHVSMPNHSHAMEPKMPTTCSRQTCWHDLSPWTCIHGLVKLEFTRLSKRQTHITCVCPQLYIRSINTAQAISSLIPSTSPLARLLSSLLAQLVLWSTHWKWRFSIATLNYHRLVDEV